ncbi:hypothetical protein NNC19_10180 [Clostridium sp. SHJSY1]|uniref:hypothetical protein n=1 Tax=Clostridium sp. SHJSY1 TaxID=2942483 RepID=UPI0028743535|nr:hypothetical protein [Clostridium sp. SHJSY1]MDS0526047.1 hypothetical protein [Clostridium sp. SHJSY1]
MVEVDFNIDHEVPQYSCNSCYNCQSVFGTSLCEVKNRGCCWYFPKFTLHEIHKMVKSEEGMKILKNILSLPKVKIYNHYIHAEGYFDKEGYKKFINSEEGYESEVKDKTIFFRACPFVKSGKGCTLPKMYRSYVCNFFICEEIVKQVQKDEKFNSYIKERDSYVHWVDWENRSLEMLLNDSKINLINNFEQVVELLKNTPLRVYELKSLDTIVVEGDEKKLG